MNWLAIGLAALSRVVLVAVWWSPPLFQRRWLTLTEQTEESMRKNLAGGTIFAIAGSLIMAPVFDWVILKVGLHSAPSGALAGLALWAGFVMPPMLSSVVYEGKPFQLFLINSGFQLAALLCMGAILGGLA
jgi:Protein of unknown function (DUF1761)